MDPDDVIKNEMYMHLEVMFFYTKTFFVRYAVEFDSNPSFHIIFLYIGPRSIALQDLGMFGSINRLIYFLEVAGWFISCSRKVVVQFIFRSGLSYPR